MKREQILLGVTLVSLTIAIFSIWNQKNLNDIVAMQNAKISELIKVRKDWQFGNQVSNDNSLTSIEELKQLVKKLADKTNVLGTTSTMALGGIVTLNNGITSVNIYDNPSISANIISSTLPAGALFFSQKQPGWHLVEYGTNLSGWVADDVVTETTQ